MKKIIFLGMLISTIFLSCIKERDEQYNGIITGIDLTMTPCSGGYYIRIEDSTYRFFNLPPNSGIDLAQLNGAYAFPVYVVVTWHKFSDPCWDNGIVIDAMRKK